MNKFIGIGNLTKAPDLRETANGKSVANLTIAINRDYGEGVDYFTVVVWGDVADNCKKYLDKGSKIGVVGTLQNRSFESQDGYKKYVTEIQASNIEFLTFKDKKEENKNETATAVRHRPQLEELPDDGTLPF